MAAIEFRVRQYQSDQYVSQQGRQCCECGMPLSAADPAYGARFTYPSINPNERHVRYVARTCLPCAPVIASRIAESMREYPAPQPLPYDSDADAEYTGSPYPDGEEV